MSLKPIMPSPFGFDIVSISGSIAKMCEKKEVNVIHFDVFDENFSPKHFDGLTTVNTLRDILEKNQVVADIHLVVANPMSYLLKIIDMNIQVPVRVATHIEVGAELKKFLAVAKKHKISPGLAIKLRTPLPAVESSYYTEFDFFHLICNDEDAGLSSFQETVFDKVSILRGLIPSSKTITLDCGVKENHLVEGKRRGVDLFVMGSAIFKSLNPEEVISTFNKKLY